jgi:pSer/pThr/pTyr-binding forkhead associated (FHA) protein
MSKNLNVKITSELKNPSEAGVHHRLLCMTGPSKGKVFYLIGKRIIIGRGDAADVQIVDVKISREHAELSFAESGYTITDLGTENGIIVNDSKIKQKKLEDNEKIVIGQTVLKYNIIEVLKSSIVNYEETATVSVKNKTTSLKNTSKYEASEYSKKTSTAEKGKPKILIFGLLIAVVFYVLFGTSEPTQSKRIKTKEVNDFDIPLTLNKKESQDDAESKKKLDSYIHSGRREFSEGNYFRAIEDFRLALLLSPNNGHASFYLSKAKQRLDEDIEKNFLKGKQEYESKKFQASIVSYCGVIQLIQNYPNDERYKNAGLKISAIESELGMEKGEIKCFEEKSADPRN